MIREGKEVLAYYDHPDPYVGEFSVYLRACKQADSCAIFPPSQLIAFYRPPRFVTPASARAAPYMPGGTLFMRYNPPGPVASFPDGLPEEADVAPKTVEYVQVPKSGIPEGYDSVLVDYATKKAE